LLGRHILRAALDDAPSRRRSKVRECFGDAEVNELDRPTPRQHDVGRRNIAVNDAQGLARYRIFQLMGIMKSSPHALNRVEQNIGGNPLLLA